jgi:hypothetical protein
MIAINRPQRKHIWSIVGTVMCLWAGGSLSGDSVVSYSIRFQPVTVFGNPAPYELVGLQEWDSAESRLPHCKGLECGGLKTNTYVYRLRSADTGDSTEGRILVTEAHQLLTVVVGKRVGGFSLTGTVREVTGQMIADSVRAQAINEGWNSQVVINAGAFSFDHMPEGRFLLMFFRGGQLIHTELLDPRLWPSTRLKVIVDLGEVLAPLVPK